MVLCQFRPDPDGANNPFVAGIDGQGPSSRNWGLSHLRWLRVDFRDEWPLFSDPTAQRTGLFDKKFSTDSKSRFSCRLKERLGLPWDQILEGRHLPPHYAALSSLSEPRCEERINCLASSSVIVPSQDPNGFGLDQNEPALGRLSRSYSPFTPTRSDGMSKHTLSLNHLASSPPDTDWLPEPALTTQTPITPLQADTETPAPH